MPLWKPVSHSSAKPVAIDWMLRAAPSHNALTHPRCVVEGVSLAHNKSCLLATMIQGKRITYWDLFQLILGVSFTYRTELSACVWTLRGSSVFSLGVGREDFRFSSGALRKSVHPPSGYRSANLRKSAYPLSRLCANMGTPHPKIWVQILHTPRTKYWTVPNFTIAQLHTNYIHVYSGRKQHYIHIY